MIDLPDLPPESLVAVDTETSGLHPDDGARVAMVQIAWYDGGGSPGTVDLSDPLPKMPNTRNFAFDQGWLTPLGEKERPAYGRRKPQPSLFEDNFDAAPNLPPDDYFELLEWLEQHALVMFNAKFDLHMLRKGLRGMEDRPTIDLSRSLHWDCWAVNSVLWPEHRTGLKPTAKRLFGESEGDAQVALNKWLSKNNKRFDLAPWDLIGPYAAKDAEQTLRIFDVQNFVIDLGEVGDPESVRRTCEREIDFAITLYRMEQRGIGFDSDECLDEAEKISAQYDAVTRELRAEISEQVPHIYPSPDSVPSITEHLMRDLWYKELGLFPAKITEKGTPSVADDVVRDLEEAGTAFARRYREMNKLHKCLSMWYTTWPKMTGPPEQGWHPFLRAQDRLPRLRTVYNQGRTFDDGKTGGTVSGRLAVSRVQLQAIPQNYQIPEGIKPIRAFFKPDPHYALWEIDLGQAEFRVAAGIAKCTKMLNNFRDGLDVHDATTADIFGTAKDDPEFFFHRQVAKRLGFGMLYGAGAETIRRQIEEFTGRKPPLEELQEWLAVYRKTYPELGRESRRAQKQVEHSRRLTLAGGRIRWFHYTEAEHKAFNQLVQGGVAEMMKEAMIEIEANIPGIMLLQVHDSVVVEVPVDDNGVVDWVRKILEDTFANEFGAPFITDAKPWNK